MNEERFLKIILSPHISEKATIASDKRNEYVFEVLENATKPEVKGAIEFLFNVKVSGVRILNVIPKKKVFKNVRGNRKGWKKAYVTLQANQKLDILGAQ